MVVELVWCELRKKMSRDSLQILPDPAVDFIRLAEAIKAWVNELGFQEISIADADFGMTQAKSSLFEWLSKGYHDEIDYMATHGTRRIRPAELVSGTLCVVSARMNDMPSARDN